jgi:hypothetical protein
VVVTVSDGFELDIAAGELRADARDIPQLIDALGRWLEQSVPHLAKVERKRAGLLDSRRYVSRITCTVGEQVYTLAREGAGATAHRAKAVRGITLKTETLSLSDWVAELTSALVREAKVAEASFRSLRDLLA